MMIFEFILYLNYNEIGDVFLGTKNVVKIFQAILTIVTKWMG